MAKIRITPETLEAQANKLNGYNEQHKQAYQQIQTLIKDLSSEWEGEAFQAFTQSFAGQEATFKKFAEDIETFRQRMVTAANEMRAAEEQVKAKMSQM